MSFNESFITVLSKTRNEPKRPKTSQKEPKLNKTTQNHPKRPKQIRKQPKISKLEKSGISY